MWEKGEFSYGLHRSIQRTYHVILSTPFAKLSYAMPLSTLLCIVAVIEQFRFHSGPHALAAGVIMASATCTVHALLYAILPDYVPVKLAGVLASPITVDNCPMQDMSSPRFPVSAHIMELSYSYPSPAQPRWNRSSQKQRKHTAFHRWL